MKVEFFFCFKRWELRDLSETLEFYDQVSRNENIEGKKSLKLSAVTFWLLRINLIKKFKFIENFCRKKKIGTEVSIVIFIHLRST